MSSHRKSFGYSMASSVQRIAGHARALRVNLVPWTRPFSADALVEVQPGEIGIVSGIPEEHLRRRVQTAHTFFSIKLFFQFFLPIFQMGYILSVFFPFQHGLLLLDNSWSFMNLSSYRIFCSSKIPKV